METEAEQTLTHRKPEEEEAKAETTTEATETTPATTPEEPRVKRLIRGAMEHMPEGVKKAAHALEPVTGAVHKAFVWLWPHLVWAWRRCDEVYEKMPQYSVVMIYGLCVAFFGAHFAAIVAVVEAFKQTGAAKKIGACVHDLVDSFHKLRAENAKDNAIDADGDGILDVDELSDGELFLHKCALVMRTIDPHRVNKALSGLYQGFLAAVMVVQYKFAKTVTLGASLGSFLERSVRIVLDPLLDATLPEEYHGWIELLTSYICKALGVAISWSLQFYNSLLHCAVSGSLIFSRALVSFLHMRGQIKVNIDDTYLDEIIGWCLALVSIAVQGLFGFHLIFPFNVLFAPFLGIEWTLRYYASDATFGQAATVSP